MKKLDPHIRRWARALRVPISSAHVGYVGHCIHLRASAVRRAGVGVDWHVDLLCLGKRRAWFVFYPPESEFTTRAHLRQRSGRWFVSSRSIAAALRQFAGGAPRSRFRFLGAPRRMLSSDRHLLMVVWQVSTTPVRDLYSINAEYHPH